MNHPADTPIYRGVLHDLKWHPDMLRPPLDLDSMIRASYDRPRHDPPPGQHPPVPAARGRGRSSTGAASTKKRAPRRTTTKKPTGDADA